LCDSKGVFAWDILSRTVGPADFSRALHEVTSQYAFKSILWEQFVSIVQRAARTDLDWLFRQWFEQTGAPDWQLAWRQEGGILHGTISQASPYYRAELEVLAEGKEHQELIRTIEVNGPRTEFTWPVDFMVDSMTLDPHFLVLHWTREYRAQANGLVWVTRGYDRIGAGQPADAYREFEAGIERVPDPDLYGVRFELELGLARLLIKD